MIYDNNMDQKLIKKYLNAENEKTQQRAKCVVNLLLGKS